MTDSNIFSYEKDLRGKNILVTGARGFIASQLIDRLNKIGANTIGVVRDSADKIIWTPQRVVVGDVADYELMRRVISTYEVDVIYHLAANAIVRTSARDPMTTYQSNVMGTVALLEAARNVGRCKQIVVASSDKAYGDHADLPYKESHSLQPKNTYDTSKACVDMIARSYGHNYGMPISVTRCSNVYGPGDMNFSRIIPNTIRRIIEGKLPMLYSDIEHMEREFIYIADVVDAYIRLGVMLSPSVYNNVYNIGGTGPIKIRDLVSLICREMGRIDVEPIVERREPLFMEIQRQYIDASRLKRTGWSALYSLEKGIEETVRWYTAFFKWGTIS